MKKIRNWTAERSGPTMTVKGWGDDGERVKITNVAELVSSNAGVVATLKATVEDTAAESFLLIVGVETAAE